MPHIVIEYSKNLSNEIKESDLTAKLHKAVTNIGLFSPEAVKARSIAYEDFVLPENAKNFIHITLSILDNKNEEQRKELSGLVFELAKKSITNCDKLSVNIHEMNIQTYRK